MGGRCHLNNGGQKIPVVCLSWVSTDLYSWIQMCMSCGSRKDICKCTNAKATLRLEDGISQPKARPKGAPQKVLPMGSKHSPTYHLSSHDILELLTWEWKGDRSPGTVGSYHVQGAALGMCHTWPHSATMPAPAPGVKSHCPIPATGRGQVTSYPKTQPGKWPSPRHVCKAHLLAPD